MPRPRVTLDLVSLPGLPWPAEIAWVAADLSAGERWLVAPPAEWLEAAAEDGVELPADLPPPEDLEAAGEEPRRLVRRLNEDLAGCEVVAVGADSRRAALAALAEATPLSVAVSLREAAGLHPPPAAEDAPAVLRACAAAGARRGPAADEAVRLALRLALAAGGEAPATLIDRARTLLARLSDS